MQKKRLIIAGILSGMLNGLFGAGGGMIAVPMLERGGISTREAHATSLAVIVPLSIVSGIFYLWGGHMNIGEVGIFILPGLIGAGIGGMILPHIKTKWLHRIFGILVIIAAIRLLIS